MTAYQLKPSIVLVFNLFIAPLNLTCDIRQASRVNFAFWSKVALVVSNADCDWLVFIEWCCEDGILLQLAVVALVRRKIVCFTEYSFIFYACNPILPATLRRTTQETKERTLQ